VYIRTVNESRGICFSGNVSDQAMTTTVQIRGEISPELWHPHDGSMSAAPCTYGTASGQDVTNIVIPLLARGSYIFRLEVAGRQYAVKFIVPN
jgi:hypothetical protein